MIYFFHLPGKIIALDSLKTLIAKDSEKLSWLFGSSEETGNDRIKGYFIGPRKEMITPWSTNAVEISQNMGIKGITRIEEFFSVSGPDAAYDPMLQNMYKDLGQDIFHIDRVPEPVYEIDDIAAYNESEGLALSDEEIKYLEDLSKSLGRKLSDSEVFGFSQVNSEHCRHKIFNGKFIIDGEEKESTLFALIKKTTLTNRNNIVSAYRDNCSFARGPLAELFAPLTQDKADFFTIREVETVLSLKAETHNFPTTVEPFNGASTGTGGEIRDRIAGGKGAFPIAGTAVYMTSYPRSGDGRDWEKEIEPRKWLYHMPEEILIKASNGASDFGNKFGQPLICGSLLTFEHKENDRQLGYDKVIMLAGGIGFGKMEDSEKDIPQKGDLIVMLGGDNYRIGMGGGAVSSVETGRYDSAIELNAVQRANPEMQKRVYNALRALGESESNPIISLHDHGAGGHLNCLSELVEATGGKIEINKLPVGDPTLSDREIIGNESQERMGLVISKKDVDQLIRIAERERAPVYVIGEVTGDHQFTFENSETGNKPIDLQLTSFFGDPPQTVMKDITIQAAYREVDYDINDLQHYVKQVMQIEEVACKDWLTNKVDRSVSGRIAKQQCAGELQLPLNNLGAIALDYRGVKGLATSIGHAPAAGLINPAHGSVLSIAEALTNIIWAPLKDGISAISLSANWMWPCKNPGEDARLYEAVEAASNFAISLGINIPTGKDSLSMTQKYKDGTVISPGTVIISASGEVTDVRRIIEPVMVPDSDTSLLYIDMSRDSFKTGGSSFAQVRNRIGTETPTVNDPEYFKTVFNTVHELVNGRKILAGHDISSGGMITTLLEMCFANTEAGMSINLDALNEDDIVKLLFSENPGIIIQVDDEEEIAEILLERGITFYSIGKPSGKRAIFISKNGKDYVFDIEEMRNMWFRTSYLFDRLQCGRELALEKYENYHDHGLVFNMKDFTGSLGDLGADHGRKERTGVQAAIIREKGVNGDREMAYALHLAGFDVKDVHMTDLISGKENLEDVNMIVFVGGFSNSDVLGSARGWAGAFTYNEKARISLENFYKRNDTLSLGVCNGCQLMAELDLICPGHKDKPTLRKNASGKFESAFLTVDILESNSVMLKGMEGMKLGIWVAHGEGRFGLPYDESAYNIPVKYHHDTYPANPNGSQYNTAALCSENGRHLAIMPHLERSFMPWQCAFYPEERRADDVTPWMQAFINAKEWIRDNRP
ncbi:MAG: phosphoribosylformylglycinamidine synthase [Bacteroidales bacterium]|jgi:phosphoribosylformylglycinamidine synthase|nr:phosphoribosylformylglycinamidine synthase [Bacteroidales bacterium]